MPSKNGRLIFPIRISEFDNGVASIASNDFLDFSPAMLSAAITDGTMTGIIRKKI